MSLDDVIAKINEALDFRKTGTVAGIEFELSVLSLREEQILNDIDSDELDGISYFNEMRKTALSFAISKIDGVDVPDIVSTKDDQGNPVTKERPIYLREFMDKIPSKAVEELFEMYIDLREEAEDKMDKQMEFKWYKDPTVRAEERKEAARQTIDNMAEAAKGMAAADDEAINLRKIEEPPEPEAPAQQ